MDIGRSNMPYISQNKRKQPDMVRLTRAIARAVESGAIDCRGDMNYVYFYMARRYMNQYGYTYHKISDVKNAAKDSADEINRRFMDKRENKAIEENGDVE